MTPLTETEPKGGGLEMHGVWFHIHWRKLFCEIICTPCELLTARQ